MPITTKELFRLEDGDGEEIRVVETESGESLLIEALGMADECDEEKTAFVFCLMAKEDADKLASALMAWSKGQS